ncbi:MAG TPA: methyltransferase domain-containing protein [Phototrophicaceae bacterium]|nr:methyltransferase domain-containing protein [Phototrophicaceae bacterium]
MFDYDQLAAEYARNRQINPEVMRALSEAGAVTPKSQVLEVGCGTGNYIMALAASTGCCAWGVEPSAEMLNHAQQRLSPVQFQPGQAERINLPSSTFDLVFTVDVIHHVTDRPAYFREVYRLLKPGGRVCTVTDSEAIIRRRQPLSTYFPETVEPELKRYPALADLHTYMAEAGFAHIEEQNIEFIYALTDIQPYRARAYSVLHLITDAAWQAGLKRLEMDLQRAGRIPAASLYVLLWGQK